METMETQKHNGSHRTGYLDKMGFIMLYAGSFTVYTKTKHFFGYFGVC